MIEPPPLSPVTEVPPTVASVLATLTTVPLKPADVADTWFVSTEIGVADEPILPLELLSVTLDEPPFRAFNNTAPLVVLMLPPAAAVKDRALVLSLLPKVLPMLMLF